MPRPGPATAHRHRGRSLRRSPHQWGLIADVLLVAVSRSPARPRRRPPAPRLCPPDLPAPRPGPLDLPAPQPGPLDLPAPRPGPLDLPPPTGTAAVPTGPSGASIPAVLALRGVARCVDSLSGQAPPPTSTAACPAAPSGALHFCLGNFARNSPAGTSNHEVASLQLQRFWAVFKSDRRKLCATFV